MSTTRLLLWCPGDFGMRVAQGVVKYFESRLDWEFHLENNTSPIRLRESIGLGKAHGIITHAYDGRVDRLIKKSGLPCVVVNSAERFHWPVVRMDSVALGRMAARHFLNSGLRHFGYSAWTTELHVQERCEGFCEELRRAGLSCDVCDEDYVWQREKSRRRMDRWLSGLKKPVGILCMYDQRGQELVNACRRLNLRIPDEVAIMGAGNSVFCQTCSPRLSSVDPDVERLGFEAGRLIDGMLDGKKAPKEPVVVSPRRVVARQSSDTVAVEDVDVAAALRLIRQKAGEPLSVKELLHTVPISRKALERKFERSIGRTPKEEIMRVKVERARALLEETDLAIPVVAERCGCTSGELFARFFRGREGMTPTAYRRTHQRRGF